MEPLEAAFLGTGVAMASVLLGWLRMVWNDTKMDLADDQAFARWWHERIPDEDENNGHEPA